MARLDKASARRVRQAVERFAENGAGNVGKLQGIDPPEYRLRVGDLWVRFHLEGNMLRVLPASATEHDRVIGAKQEPTGIGGGHLKVAGYQAPNSDAPMLTCSPFSVCAPAWW